MAVRTAQFQGDLFPRSRRETAPPVLEVRNFRKDFPLIPRDYQKSIAISALGTGKDGKPLSTLVVLPPSLGKTLIAGIVAGYKLDEGDIAFIGHNGPLVRQQSEYFKAMIELPEGQIRCIVGTEITAKKRSKLYVERPRIIVATSHTIENDLESSRFSLEGFSLLISDETHYTVGEYPHHGVAKAAIERGVPILALTASPGDNLEKIKEIIGNLRINNIEIRTRDDEEVKPYIPKIDYILKEVELPRLFKHIRHRIYELSLTPFLKLQKMEMLDEAYQEMLREDILQGGWFENAPKLMTFDVLSKIGEKIKAYDAEGDKEGAPFEELNSKQIKKRMATSLITELRLYYDLLNVFETESLFAGIKYIENNIFGRESTSRINRIMEEASTQKRPLSFSEIRKVDRLEADRSKAFKKRIRNNQKFASMYDYISKAVPLQEHPKIDAFRKIVLEEYPNTRFIVFSEFREQVMYLKKFAESLGIKASVLLGKKNEITAKDQNEAVESFRSGESRLLIATRAGREGLDLPSASVIDYDQVGTAIASTQRDGRAGRTEPGMVIKLVALGTADETAVYRAARARKTMETALRRLKRDLEANSI